MTLALASKFAVHFKYCDNLKNHATSNVPLLCFCLALLVLGFRKRTIGLLAGLCLINSPSMRAGLLNLISLWEMLPFLPILAKDVPLRASTCGIGSAQESKFALD